MTNKKREFTHLHLHTEYSLLDGANKIKSLSTKLKELGMTSVAMTDHGNMFGAIDFYKHMKKEGLKPIIGMETYLHNSDNLSDKSTRKRFHLCLYAKNETGYKNLMYLSSKAYLEGFYYYPRINKKLLKEHSSGLVCSSACLQGEVNWHLNMKNPKNQANGAKGYDEAKKIAQEYQEIFGDDFYLEIMRHGISDQNYIDEDILKISKETGIKIIATNDTHYTVKNDASSHEAFMCIAMNKLLDDPDRLKHSVHEFYLKSPQDMQKLFMDIPEAISNTQEIVQKCNLELKLGDPTPPNFKFTTTKAKAKEIDLPEPDSEYSLENDKILFAHECKEGLKNILKNIDKSKHNLYEDRLNTEINTINDMKFPGYMLIVWDFVQFAKKTSPPIPVGPGRGSAAGSLVAYCLSITDVDPLKYGLIFERFLNPGRVSMPDIDMDFCQNRRQEVIDYVVSQYGRENVAQIITFGKLMAKGVIRDVSRVMGLPLKQADKLAKLIPNKPLNITLEIAKEKEPKIEEFCEDDPIAKKVWDHAIALEGLNRNAGTHAAGVVISNEPLYKKTPLFRPSGDDQAVATQYSGYYVEDVDLIKFDFLGLKTLTVIDDTLKLVKKRYNKTIDFDKEDKNNKEIYTQISSGDTIGLFQIEASGVQELCKKLKPDKFDEIVAIIALYRPGPIEAGMVNTFVERKNGDNVSYFFDEFEEVLKPILKETYGVIVYQEQVMKIVQAIGGFSLAEADLVRRAMGKKNKTQMANIKEKFAKGGEKKGFDIDHCAKLFDMIEKFAGYGFNKSHSVAYAMVTFYTAYLKRYYPTEFMASLLTSEENKTEKIAKYIDELKRMGYELVPPDINRSLSVFSSDIVEEKELVLFGMGALKGAGHKAIDSILHSRKDGKFKDMADFVSRIDGQKVNKRVIETLIKSGSFDCFGYSRKALINQLEYIMECVSKANQAKKMAKDSLFGDDKELQTVDMELNHEEEYESQEILSLERESLGFYVSGHPLDEYREVLDGIDYVKSSDFDELEDGQSVTIVGLIEYMVPKTSRQGNTYFIVNLIDLHGSYSFMLFPNHAKKLETEYDTKKPIVFKAIVKKDDFGIKFNILSYKDLKDAKKGKKSKKPTQNEPLKIKIIYSDTYDEVLEKLHYIVANNQGKRPLQITITSKLQDVVMNSSYFVSTKVEKMVSNLKGVYVE